MHKKMYMKNIVIFMHVPEVKGWYKNHKKLSKYGL